MSVSYLQYDITVSMISLDDGKTRLLQTESPKKKDLLNKINRMEKVPYVTKSDRINALRKQYDAFLDEDKKRKDRNEFILGRLEKMRIFTPAVLPVRNNLGSPQMSKYHFLTQERPEYLRKIRFDDNSILHSRATDVIPDYVIKDEQKILQEISKKYILIPKLRSFNENSVTHYNPSSVSNDVDWRNKYNILDELKKFEKEGSSEVSKDSYITSDTFKNRENNDIESRIAATEKVKEQTLNINRDPIYNIQQKNEKGCELQSNDTNTDKPDHNIECKTTLENEHNIIPNTVKNIDFENEIVLPRLDSMNQKRFSNSNKVNEESYSSENIVKPTPRNENNTVDKSNYNQPQDVQQKVIDDNVPTNAQISDSVRNIKNETVTQKNTVELCNPEIDDTNIKLQLIEKENIDSSSKVDKIVAHPVESIENIEPRPNVDQSETVLENIKQQNYEPNDETTIVSENVIPSQIDEFEAEQNEMFYSEETGYNQNVDTMGYNEQNEEYANEQYPYYNESQQEQPYYAEINEHEEATERYDPNYEQQYVENYEENTNIAYDNHQYVGHNYENQQEVTNINYEQPDQQELTNVNYEQQPGQQDLTNTTYEQQPPNYEYKQAPHLESADQSQIGNINTYDGQASELVNYETQQYNEVGEVEHPTIPNQNQYESQQDYVQMQTEQETPHSLEQQLDEQEGYIETKNTYPTEHVTAAVKDTSKIEPNIRAT